MQAVQRTRRAYPTAPTRRRPCSCRGGRGAAAAVRGRPTPARCSLEGASLDSGWRPALRCAGAAPPRWLPRSYMAVRPRRASRRAAQGARLATGSSSAHRAPCRPPPSLLCLRHHRSAAAAAGASAASAGEWATRCHRSPRLSRERSHRSGARAARQPAAARTSTAPSSALSGAPPARGALEVEGGVQCAAPASLAAAPRPRGATQPHRGVHVTRTIMIHPHRHPDCHDRVAVRDRKAEEQRVV
eukprot:scaffold2126_cov417-Prasinococcus_capsulatus_cf.AAC.1